MKTNTLASKLLVTALGAATLVIVAPAHAQFVFQKAMFTGYSDGSTNPDSNGATHTVPTDPMACVTKNSASITVSAQATNSGTTEGSQSTGQFTLNTQELYMWMGTGPVPSSGYFTAGETDTLSCTCTKPAPTTGPTNTQAEASAGTMNTKAISAFTAGTPRTPPMPTNNYGPTAGNASHQVEITGFATEYDNNSLSADANGEAGPVGASYNASATTSATFK